jgi:hypothetical protein
MAQKLPQKISPLFSQVLAGLLWLASGALGLYAVYSISKLTATVYALLGGNRYYNGVLASQVLTLIMAFVWITMFIVTGEYIRKHPGERSSWKLLAWVLGIELLIILLGLLFG